MNRKYNLKIRPSTRGGFTLFELLIASSISVFLAVGGVYLSVFTLRSFRVLSTQMRSQLAASQGLQNSAGRLRNAMFSSIAIFDDSSSTDTAGNEIVFRTLDSATTESLKFAGTTLYYIPDTGSSASFRMVRDLEKVRFIRLNNQMIQVEAEFKYPKFRGFGTSEADRLNGTFVTRVFPRNP